MQRVVNLENFNSSGKDFHTTVQDGISATGKFGIGKLRGVCFRVSYQWLLATWKGQIFNYGGLNLEDVYTQQMAYLSEADKLKNLGYDKWFPAANKLSQTTLHLWGQPNGHSCAQPLTTANLATASVFAANPQGIQPDLAAIVGFFGDVQSLWGHATAYCCRNGVPKYFDINYGIYDFDAKEDRPAAIQSFIQSKYCSSDKVRDYVVYQIY